MFFPKQVWITYSNNNRFYCICHMWRNANLYKYRVASFDDFWAISVLDDDANADVSAG